MITIDVDALAASIIERLPHASPWLTRAEAAKYLRTSQTWLKDHPEVPHYKVDGRVLYRRAELDEYVTNHRR